MQPKQYTDPKIALLNIELELKAERDNAEVRLESVEVMATFGRTLYLFQTSMPCSMSVGVPKSG